MELQEHFEFTDDFNTEVYAEGDIPDGIMIQVNSFEPYQNVTHLPKEKALELAYFILNTIKKQKDKNKKFKSFYFSGDVYDGRINNKGKAKNILEKYKFEILRKATAHPIKFDEEIRFGFRPEYSESLTLGDWLEQNNMIKFFS